MVLNYSGTLLKILHHLHLDLGHTHADSPGLYKYSCIFKHIVEFFYLMGKLASLKFFLCEKFVIKPKICL